jgi:hypothetical protein
LYNLFSPTLSLCSPGFEHFAQFASAGEATESLGCLSVRKLGPFHLKGTHFISFSNYDYYI